MRRDTTGKFVRNWDDETKQRVSVTLTATAWRLLEEQSQKLGISRSEVIEQMARSFAQADHQSQQKDEKATAEAVQVEPPRTELALQNSEAELRLFIQQAPVSVAMLDKTMHYVAASQRWVDVYKLGSIEAVLGRSHYDIFPDLPEHWKQIHQRCLAGAIEQCDEDKFVLPNGSEQHLRWEVQPWYVSTGDIGGVVIFSEDITERKQAEQALRESEERYRTIVHTANEGIWLIGPEAQTLYSNDRMAEMLGYTAAEMLERTVLNCCFAEDIALGQERIGSNLRGNKEQFDFRFQRKDGSELLVLACTSPVFDGEANIVGALGMFTDVTARQQAEIERERLLQELETERARLEAVLRQMPAGVFIADAISDQVVMTNDQAKQITGYQFEQPLQPEAYDSVVSFEVFHLDGRRYAPDEYPLVRALRQGDTVTNEEMELCRADGSRILISANSAPIFNNQSEIVAAVVVVQDVTDRKRAEAALRNSAERLSVALAAAKLGDWSWEAATDRVTFSERAAEIFGIPPGPYMTWTQMQTLLHETDRERARLQVEQAIADYSDYDIEYRVIHADGTERWVAAKGRAQYNSSGQVLGMLGVVQDITDRKQAEQEREQLLAREKMAREEAETAREQIFGILGSITDGFLAFDRQWRFTYLNQEGSRTLGRSPAELLGKNVWEEFPELADTEFGQLYQRAVAEGTPLELEGYYAPFDSWFSVRAYPSSVGLSLYFRNINDRKQAEAKIALLNRNLQNRVNELQTLFEVIPIGILITDDLTFKQIRSNPAFTRILGITAENASSTPPAGIPLPSYKIFSYGKELTPEETPLRRAAIEEIEIKGTEVDILRGDGTLFNLYGYASPLFDEQGQVRGAVGAFLDITERKQSELEREQLLQREQAAREQAEAANRIKDEFLAVLSHELRTPLNPILGWTKLLRTGKLNAQKTAIALETIERNVKLQTQLIEDLLDVSRILRGKLSLNMAPVDLPLIIKEALETVRLAAEAKALQIDVVLNPIAGPVLGDSARLQQVVWNLLSNAVKFTPEGGRVEVRLEEVSSIESGDRGDRGDRGGRGGSAQITVSDTGRGISPDFLPYVFDYFRQADATTTRQFGGLGLGLAIVRQLVELHGGTVQAISAGENQGTTFIVKLPLLKNYRKTIGSKTDALYPSSSVFHPLQGIRVLIVDDEADARDLITFILEEAGAIPTVAASAIEALTLFPQLNPDVIVSDVGMPEMDGYTLIQQIRKMPPEQGGQVPAVALTAYAGESNQRRAIATGFQYHLTKPVEPNELIEVIVSLLKRAG